MTEDHEPLGAALFDAYPAPRVRADLADRVLAPRRRRSPAWGIVAVCAVLALLLVARHRPPSSGFVVASSRTVIALGPDVDAVAEAGAILAWNGRHVRQLAGRVFYQTRGTSLEVGTPSALVVDIGTKFEVEVRPMKKALVVAGVVVLLYVVVREGRVLLSNEAGRVEIAAGEAAQAAPGVTPSRVEPVIPKAPVAAVRKVDPVERQALETAIHDARIRRQSASSPAESAPASEEPVPIDPLTLRRTVREVMPLIAECYNLGLERDPGLRGSLVVSFVIAGEPDIGGVVRDVSFGEGSDLVDPDVRECIASTFASLEFPAPAEGGEVTVDDYRFTFTPDEERVYGRDPDRGQAPPENP